MNSLLLLPLIAQTKLKTRHEKARIAAGSVLDG